MKSYKSAKYVLSPEDISAGVLMTTPQWLLMPLSRPWKPSARLQRQWPKTRKISVCTVCFVKFRTLDMRETISAFLIKLNETYKQCSLALDIIFVHKNAPLKQHNWYSYLSPCFPCCLCLRGHGALKLHGEAGISAVGVRKSTFIGFKCRRWKSQL